MDTHCRRIADVIESATRKISDAPIGGPSSVDPYNERPWAITTARRLCRSSSSLIGRARCAARVDSEAGPPTRRWVARTSVHTLWSASYIRGPSTRRRARSGGPVGPARAIEWSSVVQRRALHSAGQRGAAQSAMASFNGTLHLVHAGPLTIPNHQSQGTPSLSVQFNKPFMAHVGSDTGDSNVWHSTYRDHQR